MPKVILALPAFNEAENLSPLVRESVETFRAAGLDYEILVVNDGSTDATADVLAKLEAEYGVHAVTHPQNLGLGRAIMTGISAALARTSSGDDVIVNMDADNTHAPSYIPAMAEKIWSGQHDVVIASRFREGSSEVGVPFSRRILSRGARLLFQVFLRLPEVRDYTCGYRAYRAQILHLAMERYGERLITRQGFACTDELLVKLSTITRRMTEVPFVLRYDQKKGRSKLPLLKTIVETLKMLISHR
jgi:dolichol-phosphate mannosyltransferase